MPHATYAAERLGSAEIEPRGSFEAGSFASFTLTYTAGYFGIDDTGSIKIAHRFASDMGQPQFGDPEAPNYVTVEASNGAVLHIEYDPKRNIRPWDKTLYIKVVRGFLRRGDRIIVRFGDPTHGCPGMRLQTFCEDTFEFRVLVDAIATYDYVELPEQPCISIVPGPPHIWKAILPTERGVGQPFRLAVKGEDRWGNPSDRCDRSFQLKSTMAVKGLPDRITLRPGEYAAVVEDLVVERSGDLSVELLDEGGDVAARSNPLLITESPRLLPYWGDLHGQSEETIGTNSAFDYFEFARDRAFVDACAHQGNDFQITSELWDELNRLSGSFNQDGNFIVFPGYEWSGNTGLGGDRNVMYRHEGGPIYRSSHALVDDLSDAASDANSAQDLFTALQDEDCIVVAHVGGRYSDIEKAHDIRLERSVEVHSAWGTFEWLFEDAIDQGFRVGIVANSDGHKGRPGASHPGASRFGAYGGLTCMLAHDLSRDGLLDALRRRHHYGTTGCRMVLDVTAKLEGEGELFDDDPSLGSTLSHATTTALMGDIVRTDEDFVDLRIRGLTSAPLERLEIRNARECVEVHRPFAKADLGRRIRVVWEGAEYRGRGRETLWDGYAQLTGNRFERFDRINWYNLDKRFDPMPPDRVEWESVTTGGLAGFDAWLEDPTSGVLEIKTELVEASLRVEDIGLEDLVLDAGGLGRRMRVFRMPDENDAYAFDIVCRVPLRKTGDNVLYCTITQEDGHRIWSSPIYLFS